jgi:outer membrane protein assembly factor BamD
MLLNRKPMMVQVSGTRRRRPAGIVQLLRALVLTVAGAGFLGGCGSSHEAAPPSVEERFAQAKKMFDKGDYLDAVNEFTVITLQNQGSTFAADAQYYLGECRFMRGEYLLAVFEYSTLKRNMPASTRVPDAQYKTGLSYYYLAPKSSLDQQYTKKAIDELQSFVEYYPANEHAADANAKIRELTNRLAKKEYETARLYTTMEYYKSAIYYYDDVIEKYHDTDYAPLAYLGKVEVLISRNKYQEASVEINRFIERFPSSVFRNKADGLKESIDQELAKNKRSGGKEAGSADGGRSDVGPAAVVK